MKKGFSLIELLVAITIFSGVMVLSLGAFARSATSAYKVSASREKTETARRIVDQISNDFQYIYTPQPMTSDVNIGTYTSIESSCGDPAVIKGFCVNNNKIELLLRFPSEITYVRKVYRYSQIDGADWKLSATEQRGCTFHLSGGATQPSRQLKNCTPDIPTERIMLDITKHVLAEQTTVFSGLSVVDPIGGIPNVQRAFLQINLQVKPAGPAATCASLTGDSCYQLKTTLTAGGV